MAVWPCPLLHQARGWFCPRYLKGDRAAYARKQCCFIITPRTTRCDHVPKGASEDCMRVHYSLLLPSGMRGVPTPWGGGGGSGAEGSL